MNKENEKELIPICELPDKNLEKDFNNVIRLMHLRAWVPNSVIESAITTYNENCQRRM